MRKFAHRIDMDTLKSNGRWSAEQIPIGTKFRDITYLGDVPSDGRRRSRFLCRCGSEYVTYTYLGKLGRGCGCNRGLALGRWHENNTHPKKTHGFTSKGIVSGEYGIWVNMRSRCNNPSNKSYRYYGGRGISVSDRWMKSENFISDVGLRPSRNHSLDRIDPLGNYEPGNVRWATADEQATNRSSSRIISHDGISMTLSEWSHLCGIPEIL